MAIILFYVYKNERKKEKPHCMSKESRKKVPMDINAWPLVEDLLF